MGSGLVVADELLAALRAHLGIATLAFAQPPELLFGGYFTENHAFHLADAPAGWADPLVLRLFPNNAPADLAFREAAVQCALADQNYPAAPILWFDAAARVAGRRCFVMRRLPGRTIVGGLDPRSLARAARFGRRLPEITASAQARLHQQDSSTLAHALGQDADGVDRSLARIRSLVDDGADGLAAVGQWLVEHRPDPIWPPVICHGDLWGGNILVDKRGAVTGVLDWTTCALGERALDVGATALAFCFVPIALPRPVRAAVQGRGRHLYDSFLRAYVTQTGAELTARPYYEALRAVSELAYVAEWRLADAAGANDLPRPAWDVIPEELIGFVRDRTGVTIVLPESAR